jgi:hypothetical protein
MRLCIVGVLLVLPACASAPPWAPAARVSPTSCSAPGAPAEAHWQLVQGDNFTFCVPGDWQSIEGRRWQWGSGAITWGRGAPPPRRMVSGVVTVRVPVGGAMPSQGEIEARARSQIAAECSTQDYRETIGGQSAALYDVRCGETYSTGAHWFGSDIYLHGDADDAGTALLELQVYRTLRFLPTGAH